VLGNGVGLWEGQAIDDYETEENIGKARFRDEKLDWSKLTAADITRCQSSLSFFDADGMRFHLPAFLLHEEFEDLSGTIIFHLTSLDEYGRSHFTSLNQSQRAVIREFLVWCSKNEEFDFEKTSILRALENYWIEN